MSGRQTLSLLSSQYMERRPTATHARESLAIQFAVARTGNGRMAHTRHRLATWRREDWDNACDVAAPITPAGAKFDLG